MSRDTLGVAAGLSASHQILLQKQHEHQGLLALRDASTELLEQIEKLASMSNIMADGGEGTSSETLPALSASDLCADGAFLAIGQVMKNWPHVFAILNLFGGSSIRTLFSVVSFWLMRYLIRQAARSRSCGWG